MRMEVTKSWGHNVPWKFLDPQGNQIAILKNGSGISGHKFWLEKDGIETLTAEGNFLSHNYVFKANGAQVAEASTGLSPGTNRLKLSITGDADPNLVVPMCNGGKVGGCRPRFLGR